MKYQGINNWLANSVKLVTKGGEAGYGFLVPSAPGAAALSDAAAVDVAAGWPEGIVTKATAARRKQSLVWVGDNCIHVGQNHVPFGELWGGDSQPWQLTFTKPIDVPSLVAKWGFAYAAHANTSLSGTSPGGFRSPPGSWSTAFWGVWNTLNYNGTKCLTLGTDHGDRVAFLEDALGYDLPPGAETGFSEIGIWNGAQVRRIYEQVKAVDCTVVCVPWTTNEGYGVIWARWVQTGSWLGVRGLLYAPESSGQAAYGPAGNLYAIPGYNLSKFKWWAHQVIADQNTVEYLRLMGISRPSTTSDVPLTDGTGPYILPAVVAAPDVIPPVIPSLTKAAGWGGPASKGFYVYKVYTWGLPEFLTDFTLKGAYTITDGLIEVDDVVRNYVWDGASLAAIDEANASIGQPVLDPGERGTLSALTIRSCTRRQQLTVPTDPLTKTNLWAQAVKADFDLRNEQMIGPDEAKQLPAITFGQASAKASGQASNIWHQVYRVNEPRIQLAAKVVISGADTASLSAVAYDAANVALLAFNTQDIITAIASGVAVVNSSSVVLSDAYLALFGLDADDWAQVKAAQRTTSSEFEEGNHFAGKLWDPDKLAENLKCGYYTMVFARDRKQFSGFISAILAQAKLARKYAGV